MKSLVLILVALALCCFIAGCGKNFPIPRNGSSEKPKETTAVSYLTGIVVSQGAQMEAMMIRGNSVNESPVVLVNINGKTVPIGTDEDDTFLGTYALKQGDRIRIKKTVITVLPRDVIPDMYPNVYPKTFYSVSAPMASP